MRADGADRPVEADQLAQRLGKPADELVVLGEVQPPEHERDNALGNEGVIGVAHELGHRVPLVLDHLLGAADPRQLGPLLLDHLVLERPADLAGDVDGVPGGRRADDRAAESDRSDRKKRGGERQNNTQICIPWYVW